jgi:glycosyltransferase involved in cell wall biosynthesis
MLRILLSGRVNEEEKGLQVLLAACAKLYRSRKDFLLTATTLGKVRAPFVDYAGWSSREEALALCRDADICVIPSLWDEPFGIVALEAMAAGKPVVASKCGGLQDIVIDGKTGFLVPPGDVDALAERLNRLLDSASLRAALGAAGRRRVAAQYTWDAVIEGQYLPLFRDV